MKSKSLFSIRATSTLAIIFLATQPAQAIDYWFDQNNTAAGFGVADAATYDWLGGNLWNANNAGTAALIAWPGGSNGAFFTAAGAGTSYTVRLGATGSTDVVLKNMFLNSNGATTAVVNGFGDVVIGAVGDTGQLQINANNSIGIVTGKLTIISPVNLGASHTLNYRGGAFTINGVVSGTGTSGVILVTGGTFSGALAAGTMTLANPDNTYTGATTINPNYILALAKLADGGLTSSMGSSTTAPTNLILSGGTLRYLGATTSTDRNFTLTTATASSFDVAAADTVLTLTGASTATTGGLTKTGSGTLKLTGTNLYTGVTKISAGVLSVDVIGDGSVAGNLGNATIASANLVLGAGTLRYTGGTASTNRSFTLTAATASTIEVTNAATVLTWSGISATNTGGLTKTGDGTLVLSGANNHQGTNTVSAGTLSIGAGVNNLGALTSPLILDGGTLRITGTLVTSFGTHPTSFVTNKTVKLDINTATNTFTVSQDLNQGTGGLTKTGTGILTLSGTNTYTGPTTILGGTLTTGPTGSLANGGAASSIGQSTNAATGLVLDGGTLQYANTGAASSTDRLFSVGVGGGALDASGTDTITFAGNGAGPANTLAYSGSGTRTLTLTGTNTGSNTLAPVIADGPAGPTSLTKSGPGTWLITGQNTYTGDTIVTGGILAVMGSSIADTTKLVINGGKVAPTGTEIVNTLFFGATQQASGTWGTTGSAATHTDDVHFSGTGLLNVTTGPTAPGYASWATGFGLAAGDQDPTDDPDGDGLNNILEYVLAGNPSLSDASAIAPTGTHAGSDYVFTFKRSDLSEADTTQSVEYGNNLTVWGTYPIGASPGTAPVIIQEDTPGAALDTVTVTIPTAGAPKFFARLKVEK